MREVSRPMAFGLLVVLSVFAGSALAVDLRIDCEEGAFRNALQKVAQAGGGKITFKLSGGVLEISDTIKFSGSDVIVDGEDRNITVKYVGPDDCSQKEGQDRFIEIYGDRNVVRNLTLDHFPDGIHVQQGFDNVIENVRFPVVCEDAITAFDNARVRFEENDVHAGGKGGVVVQGAAKVDLGGGRVVVAGDSEPSRGLNTFKSTAGPVLVNEGSSPITAKNNIWNHRSAGEVLAGDVKGAVEIEPLGKR